MIWGFCSDYLKLSFSFKVKFSNFTFKLLEIFPNFLAITFSSIALQSLSNSSFSSLYLIYLHILFYFKLTRTNHIRAIFANLKFIRILVFREVFDETECHLKKKMGTLTVELATKKSTNYLTNINVI